MNIILKLPATRPATGNGMSEGERAIAEVTAAIPQLNNSGMNQPDDRSLKPLEVETAIAFLRLCQKAKTPVYDANFLKHIVQRWGGCNELSPYVSNGALIVASIYLGFLVQWDGRHVDIAVSKKDARRLDRDWDCRPVESN